MLGGVPYRVLDLTEFPSLALPAEGAASYTENALRKARAVAVATGMLALADDSGIEVDALGGRPGVLSARYGGEGLERRRALRRAAARASRTSRRRRPHRALPRGRRALCARRPRGDAEGVVEGVLLTEARGSGGFGYDPLFYYPPLGATFAEVTPEAKHAVSHRGRAMAAARRILLAWAASPET